MQLIAWYQVMTAIHRSAGATQDVILSKCKLFAPIVNKVVHWNPKPRISQIEFWLNFYRIFTFGAGKRFCPGEVLAKNRLFLFIACLLQKFTFLPTEGKTAPLHDPRTYRFKTTLHIDDYEIIAKRRSFEQY